GAGKSSVIRMIAGLEKPARGKIVIGDRVLFDSSAGIDLDPQGRKTGVVFQEPGLFPNMNVSSNLTYGNWAGKRNSKISLDQVLSILGIEHLVDRRPHTLSGGEAQRVAIGRALMSDPSILLLDEPFSALDAGRREEVLPFLEKLRDEVGIAMIYVSHSMAEVTRLASTLVVMADGGVVASGEITALLASKDIGGLTGLRMTGSLLTGRVSGHDKEFGLTFVEVGKHRLVLAGGNFPVGTKLRLRISPRDVMISLEDPKRLSARNVLPAVVEEINEAETPIAEVILSVGNQTIRASVTRLAVREMNLAPGTNCYAVLKTVALEGRFADGQ
ncbi:MAG: molybdenum ABC transporter ATP-binding protein, partial [Rhizobiaceae bacterium]